MIMELLKSLKRYKSFIVIELCTLVTRTSHTKWWNERFGRDDDALWKGEAIAVMTDAKILTETGRTVLLN